MKTTSGNHQAISGGSIQSGSFGISVKDEVHLIGILRDTIYSDKILAVLREYSSNAWDAHRTSGQGDIPIEVQIPTDEVPTLLIRDHGPGLSRDDIFTVFTQYGSSTKRGNDDAVGMLGIGSKSGFSYADSFTITSWYGGTKSIYVAALDASDRGVLDLIHEEPCEAEETGVEIQIAVKEQDIVDFTCKARTLFNHFSPRPIINIELPEVPPDRTALVTGTIDYTSGYNGGNWVAVMGCVPYRIRLNELPLCDAHKCLRKLSGTLVFNIGDVQISASREDLRYTEKTKEALIARFTDLVDEYVVHTLKHIDSLPPYEKRLRLMVFRTLELPILEEYENLAKSWVKIYDDSDGQTLISLVRHGNATNQVTIEKDTRLLLDDTGKKLAGYQFEHNDYVIRAKDPQITKEDFLVLVEGILEATLLTGIKVELLSTLPWTAPFVAPAKVSNPKHRSTMFRLLSTKTTGYSTRSDRWAVDSRVATKEDIFVVIERFEAYDGFFADYKRDSELAKQFDIDMPDVYGYKTTNKKQVDPSKIEGVEYRVWRKEFIQSLLTPDRIEIIQDYWWENQGTRIESKLRKSLAKDLGDTHPIVGWIEKQATAGKKLVGMNRSVLANFANQTGHTKDKSEAAIVGEVILERYPLLKLEGISQLWREQSWNEDEDATSIRTKAWRDYVKLVDSSLTATQNATTLTSTKGNSNATAIVSAY